MIIDLLQVNHIEKLMKKKIKMKRKKKREKLGDSVFKIKKLIVQRKKLKKFKIKK